MMAKETVESRHKKVNELCIQITELTNGFTTCEIIGVLELVKHVRLRNIDNSK